MRKGSIDRRVRNAPTGSKSSVVMYSRTEADANDAPNAQFQVSVDTTNGKLEPRLHKHRSADGQSARE